MTTIFIIDDDPSVLDSTRRWLEMSEKNVATFANGVDALAAMRLEPPTVIICDVKMQEIDGLTLLAKLQILDPELPVIMMTGHGNIAMAVEAMRLGAYDFIEKPFDPEHLSTIVDHATEKRQLSQENALLHKQLTHLSGIESKIIGNSVATQQLRKSVIGVSSFDANTIIIGETGAGKELIARCIHEYSTRSDAPFVAINCGAIPEHLFESELFGHEKGAFTGADKRRIGKLEHASDGILFLDEIESIPILFQVKLLRALQEKTIERLGSNTSIHINPRVLSATKIDLKTLAKKGDFRADLYYRLKVAEIRIPSLKQRHDDIPMLFEHFLQEAEKNYNVSVRRPSVEEMVLLQQHSWPGNIRELKNTAQRFVIDTTINGQVIDEAFLSNKFHDDASPLSSTNESPGCSLAEKVKHFEKEQICASLARHKGKIQRVMDELNITRRTLNIKMQQYQIRREEFVEK